MLVTLLWAFVALCALGSAFCFAMALRCARSARATRQVAAMSNAERDRLAALVARLRTLDVDTQIVVNVDSEAIVRSIKKRNRRRRPEAI